MHSTIAVHNNHCQLSCDANTQEFEKVKMRLDLEAHLTKHGVALKATYLHCCKMNHTIDD